MAQQHTSQKQFVEMTYDDMSRVLNAYIDDALESYEGDILEDRIQALDFYEGKLFGNEVDGCSDVVLTHFRDIVEFIMPPLMRLFTSPRNPAKFKPSGPNKEDFAAQATDYVSHILWWDNDGYNLIQDWLKNGLIYRLGVLKWWWEEETIRAYERYTGLDQPEVEVLLSEDDIEVDEIFVVEGDSIADPETGQAIDTVTYDVSVYRVSVEGKVVIHNLAPEEFIYNRTAESIKAARFLAHRQLLTVSELLERGYDVDEVMALPIADEDYSEEREHRHEDKGGTDRIDYDSPDPSLDKKLIYECYCFMDADGDGHAEYRRIVAGDKGNVILEESDWDCAPFAVASPITMPNELMGKGMGDLTMDIQFIASQIIRQSLDSLVQQNNPRKVVVEDAVNMNDVDDNSIGATIRATSIDAVKWMSVTNVAQQGLPFLEYLNNILERRTGISETSMGLNADSLQSTTEFAVTAQLTASQGKIELIARNFANSLCQLYMGVLKLVCQHQDKERVIQLRGEWVSMDPRHWDADMQATPIVGLGSGTEREKMVYMGQIINEQKELLMAGSDLATEQHLFNSYQTMVEMGGFKTPEEFFQDPSKAPPKPPEPSPAEVQAQTELQKAQMQAEVDMQKAQMDAQIDMQKAILQARIDAQKALVQMRIDMMIQMSQAEIDMDLKQRNLAIDSAIKVAELAMENSLAEKELEMKNALENKKANSEVNAPNINTNIKSPVAA